MASATLHAVPLAHSAADHRHLFELASKLYSDSITAQDAHLLNEAQAFANTAYSIRPTFLPGINLLARIELQRQQYGAAQYWVEQGLALQPDSASLLYSAGHIALSQGKLEKAEQYFEQSTKVSRVATKAVNFLAHVKLLQGEYVEAFRHYRELAKTQANDVQIRSKLFEAASHVVADFYSEELEQDLLRYLDFPQMDYSQLASLATSLLKHKLRLSEAGCPLELTTIASDPLLLKCLTRFYFCDPVMERLLITLRQSLLTSCSQSLSVSATFLPLVAAIGQQCYLNESVWYVNPTETQLIEQLSQLCEKMLEGNHLKNQDVYPALLLVMMYRPLSHCEFFARIRARDERWPSLIEHFVQDLIVEAERLDQGRAKLPSLGLSQDEVSLLVQKQYNQHPYPRWVDIGYNQPSDYATALRQAFPNHSHLLPRANSRLNVLVAGCGTGRHAIRLAQYFSLLDITALDLSHTALAYAQMQAEKRNVRNIHFIQGDILHVERLGEQFDVIECSGVLHHMNDPALGLAALAQQLKPGAVMKVALYSATARRTITKLRSLWGDNRPRSDQDMRLVREALLQNSLAGDWSDIYNSPDFYSLSACRDLLFHEQEHVFDVLELPQFAQSAGLEWMGMLPNPAVSKILGESTHPGQLSVHQWHTLEQNHPEIFAGMYQFYLYKPR